MTDDLAPAPQVLATHEAPLVQASGLACRRGRETLFKDLSFKLNAGQLLWLRGHNGSGKTSLLRMVVGLSQPHAGQLLRRAADGAERARMVYLGHSNGLKEQLTVTESLRFLAALHGLAATPEQVDAALDQLGLRQRRQVLTCALSQGQRRRVALARLALERQASVWVLDEPFDALDTEGMACVHALLARHLGRGGAVLLTSHLALDVRQLRVDVLDLDARAASRERAA